MQCLKTLVTVRNCFCRAVFWFYRNGVSPFLPASCRFQPTCSAYAREAVLKFGLLKGMLLAIERLMRCHPFYRGPVVDPVPEKRIQSFSESTKEHENG